MALTKEYVIELLKSSLSTDKKIVSIVPSYLTITAEAYNAFTEQPDVIYFGDLVVAPNNACALPPEASSILFTNQIGDGASLDLPSVFATDLKPIKIENLITRSLSATIAAASNMYISFTGYKIQLR